MPRPLTDQLVALINRCETSLCEWPQVILQGHVSSLEKHAHAMGPQDYRPITVLSLVWRVYSSIRAKQLLRWLDSFADPFIVGNRPHRATKHVWWALAEELEYCNQFGETMSGITTDVKKAFNCLPREAVIACAHRLGINPIVISGWHRAIAKVQRFFIVEGACSPACVATCGYPEGCPLSVVSMFLINQVTQAAAPCRVISYVDNWEVVSSSPDKILLAKNSMEKFTDEVGISLDQKKTYCWSLDTSGRKYFKKHLGEIKYDAKDLGGHMVYCKRATIHTISGRIKTSQDLWTWLARSPSPDKQKMQILSTVAWPRCLHGVSSVRIGIAHVKKLRSAAMSALSWDRRGAGSLLQFGISPFPKADPGFHLLWETISDFRMHARAEFAFPTMNKLAEVLPAQLPQGPSAAVINQLRQIAWRWEGDGFVADHEGLLWSLMDSSSQWLFFRLTHAWAVHVGGLLQSRLGFDGLSYVDRSVTFGNIKPWSVEQMGILRAGMNGTFYTNDALVHAGHVDSKSCAFCGQPDSNMHRLWECSHFAALRAKIPKSDQALLLAQPSCFHVHGWVLEHMDVKRFRQSLMMIRNESQEECCNLPEGCLHFFTDGACLSPTVPGARLASWAVCVADLETDQFPLISAGGIPHGYQTALRGGITAAISACGIALKHGRTFTVWTDSQSVHDFLWACQSGTALTKSARKKDHDLWNRLFHMATRAVSRELFIGVVKVQSHAVIEPGLSLTDSWALRGRQLIKQLQVPFSPFPFRCCNFNGRHCRPLRKLVAYGTICTGS